jgi:hypothetical protein
MGPEVGGKRCSDWEDASAFQPQRIGEGEAAIPEAKVGLVPARCPRGLVDGPSG